METVGAVVVGGGPVGLTLACLLALRDVDVVVLEARTQRSPHSRAIGIHPPALDVLATLDLADAIRAEAVAIGGGQVFYGARKLGRLALPEPPLALPQVRTEALLLKRLETLAPGAIRTDMEAVRIIQTSDHVRLFCRSGQEFVTKLLVGCDGAHSTVRALVGIESRGETYPDRYLMGDFEDDTEFGSDAALFFTREGIVESFPLPQKKRRWVARLRAEAVPMAADALAALVYDRTARQLPLSTCSWISPFTIDSYVAPAFLRGRVALAGDAAHVVSPIGGQGMNLGILGAATIAHAWQGDPDSLEVALSVHRQRALRVLRQAQFNTVMGRPLAPWSLRRVVIAAGLALPALSRHFGRAFTMRHG
jgi:2-polyprenyl-6-methoxyphenol hydroxylase-like FAD-dependent oxidoreductase